MDQRLGRARYIEQLSQAACTRSLFLGPVADAQGLSDYADTSLGQRLSLSSTARHHARQALITRGLVASQRPLSQVLALDAAPHEAMPSATPVTPDDELVALKVVFARIWAVLR